MMKHIQTPTIVQMTCPCQSVQVEIVLLLVHLGTILFSYLLSIPVVPNSLDWRIANDNVTIWPVPDAGFGRSVAWMDNRTIIVTILMMSDGSWSQSELWIYNALGSTDDVSFDTITSYTQSFAYPDTPDINNYDDLLFQNVFTMPSFGRCLIYSPMFWGLIVMGLCFIIWLIMLLLKLYRLSGPQAYRSRTKSIFKQLDIIHGGKRWIGGLFSLAAIVFIIFSIWFASIYMTTYPIETAKAPSSCKADMFSTQFSNGLQLPLPSQNGEFWPIFGMFDEQPLTMTVDFINTRATCDNVTIQQNRPSIQYLFLEIDNCTYNNSNSATLSVTFTVPEHPATVQLNITGVYFSGGVRLCLRGPRLAQGINTLHELDTCQLYYTENETLGHDVTIPILLIRTINQTKPLYVGEETLFDGRWTPTWNAPSGLSDRLIYNQEGDYIRYSWYQNYLNIEITELPFFVQNNQQPIIRKAELAFHTLLFTSLVIELFGFGFLVVKISIIPCFGPILRCLRLSYTIRLKEEPLSAVTTQTSRSASLPMPAVGSKSFARSKLTTLLKRRKAKFRLRRSRQDVEEVVPDNMYF